MMIVRMARMMMVVMRVARMRVVARMVMVVTMVDHWWCAGSRVAWGS